MWFNPGGNEMSEEDWSLPFARCLGMMLSGDTIDVLDFQGEPIRDDTFLFLMNAHYETISFLLPGQENIEWQLLIDTATESGFLAEPKSFASGDELPVIDRGVCLLKLSAGAHGASAPGIVPETPLRFPARRSPAGAREKRIAVINGRETN